MSLDIAVMNDDGGIDRSVSIGVEEHHRLMKLCRHSVGVELLLRLGDYYEQGEIFHQELFQLQEELRAAEIKAQDDPELVRIIRELIEVANFGRDRRRSLVALPD
jgi:hypothetical protein